MRSPDSFHSRYQFKSVSLGSNEEFVRLYNEIAVSDIRSSKLESILRMRLLNEAISENLRRLDRLLKRAERNAQLHEILAGIVHLVEQNFSPTERLIPWISADHLRAEETLLDELCAMLTNSVASGRDSAYNVVVSAVVLLALVYQYLQGCVDKGGSKTYSSGSLDFRDTFVCIVLFRGAYIWIKFRQAACPANHRKRKSLTTPHQVYRRAIKDKSGTITHFKYEPRFKPPRVRLDSGTTLKFNCLSLGQYNTHHEARIVRQIAAFYYGKEEGDVQLEDGLCFSIPSMSEQEKSLSGMEKAKWVSHKTKAVYADLLEEMERQRVQLLKPALRTNSHVGGPTADPIQFAEIEAQWVAHGTNSRELASLPAADPSLDFMQFDVSAGFAGFEDMIDELSSFWANNPAPQPSGLDNQLPSGGVTVIVAHPGGCRPQVDGVAAQDLGHREPQLTSHPMHSLHVQVNHLQELVTRQKKQLQDSAIRNVELQHQLMEVEVQKSNFERQLMESEVQYSELQRDLKHQLIDSEVQNSELQREVENLRSMLQHVANSQVAT